MIRKYGISLKFGKGDIIVISFVIILAIFIGGLFFLKNGIDKGNKVVIYENGKKVQELPLYQDTDFLIENNYTNKVAVQGGKAAIVESDCPGEDCVHSGWISGKGRSIVCLPNCVEIRIEGEVDSEVDFIVR